MLSGKGGVILNITRYHQAGGMGLKILKTK